MEFDLWYIYVSSALSPARYSVRRNDNAHRTNNQILLAVSLYVTPSGPALGQGSNVRNRCA